MKQQQKIPEGWEIKKLGEIVEFNNGKGHERDIVKNGRYIVVNSKYISSDQKVLKYSDKQLCPLFIGDVVMVMSDVPNGKAIAKCFLINKNDKYSLNQRIGSFKSKQIISEYLYFLLNRNRYFLSFDDGVNQTNLRKDDILSCRLVFPPIPEQNHIVEVLETWDKYLTKLDQKIKIKKNIKKGLAKNLLTGEIRLKRFSDQWMTVALKDISDFSKGQELSKSNLSNDGKNECILYGELFTKYNEYSELIISRTSSNLGTPTQYGDILIPSSDVTPMGLGTATAIMKEDVLIGGDINIIRPNKTIISSLFLSYLLNQQKKKLLRLVTGTTIRHLYLSDIKKIILNIPSLEEQKAIIKILIPLDREINLLKRQISIIKNQKKYLLNNLITGQIRLPEFINKN